jgi:toxin YoeB
MPVNWLHRDNKTFNKITLLICEAARDPLTGAGKPEMLKYEFGGLWSRRTNLEHRLVYLYTELEITVISSKFHYQ